MTVTIPNITVGKTAAINVADYAADGITLDTVSTLTVSSSNGNVCSAQVDPQNPRSILLHGLAGGSGIQITVGATNVPSGGNLVLIVNVVTPPNNSRIDFQSVAIV